ncbi:MAG: response regulator [Candidatus Daviesbacteria bacterium]|nr:response regulator [Candidatus Daviesbacteria bacterium]
MPEKARVFIAEDEKDWQQRIERNLKRSEHEVVLTAETLAEALRALDRFEELQVQVATLDGNLRGKYSYGLDGREVSLAIRSRFPNVKIVGLSSDKFRGEADIELNKADTFKLGEVVANL